MSAREPSAESHGQQQRRASVTDLVLLAGASSETGQRLAEELIAAGYRVCLLGRSTATTAAERFAGQSEAILMDTDLTDVADVERIAAELAARGERVAAIVHLVGGWAGGKGIAGQREESYQLLAKSFDALRHISRQFIDELAASGLARLVTVSSPLAENPTASSANYASVKAAVEAWTLACHRELAARNEHGAATVVRTDGLAGREDTFARLIAELLASPAARVGGRHVLHI